MPSSACPFGIIRNQSRRRLDREQIRPLFTAQDPSIFEGEARSDPNNERISRVGFCLHWVRSKARRMTRSNGEISSMPSACCANFRSELRPVTDLGLQRPAAATWTYRIIRCLRSSESRNGMHPSIGTKNAWERVSAKDVKRGLLNDREAQSRNLLRTCSRGRPCQDNETHSYDRKNHRFAPAFCSRASFLCISDTSNTSLKGGIHHED